MVVELSNDNFDKIIKENENVVVDFYATWCMPCAIMAPIFESLEREVKNVVFAKVNVEENMEIASRFGILSIPCFIFFKNGEVKDILIGACSKERLKEFILRNV